MRRERRWTPACAGVTAVHLESPARLTLFLRLTLPLRITSLTRITSLARVTSPRRRPGPSVVAAVILFVFTSSVAAQDFSALDAAAGQALFERNWVPAPASTAATDGLGPYYNARSCAACHADGGAGARELAQMNLLTRDALYGEMLQLRAVTGMQPELRAELAYTTSASLALGDGTRVTLSQPLLTLREAVPSHDLPARTSLRRAPGLQGLAALDLVPLTELEALADPGDENGDGISGRLAPNAGRFGWKASTPNLREQVARALSLDLGLGSPLLPSAAGDCTAQQQACLDAARAQTGDAFEAPALVLDLLLAYLSALPLPAAPAAEGPGANLFDELGCAACHRPHLQAGEGQLQAFTDLLLHDLGPGLASAGDAEWRTAPLWGLSQSKVFLHDGRAGSLDEAVLWHSGEAAASAAAYRQLNAHERGVLQAWLLGL